jgi:hypothetical protein
MKEVTNENILEYLKPRMYRMLSSLSFTELLLGFDRCTNPLTGL